MWIERLQREAYNLSEFVDSETAFISSKTQSGKALKALELPGLWNGSMAGWNTLFVEVPLETFNPVKTVNDLNQTRTSMSSSPVILKN